MGIAFRTTLGPIVAVYGAINFLNKSLQVASQRQVNIAKLTNGLKKGGTAADLEKLLMPLTSSATTLFNQEDAELAYAFLTSFQRIGVDSYERVTEAAADIGDQHWPGSQQRHDAASEGPRGSSKTGH